MSGSEPASERAVVAARVMFALPDAESIRQIAGALGYLSARKRQVCVGVQDDPPGAPGLERFDGAYVGLSVRRLPDPEDDAWRALAATLRAPQPTTSADRMMRALVPDDRAIPPSRVATELLEQQTPDVLVVSRLRGSMHREYMRAARRLGIPVLYLPLRADDIAEGGLDLDVPDCVAVWNRFQRREALALGVPVRQTSLVGAPLWTDVLDSREALSKSDARRRLGLDPARRLIVLAPPARSDRALHDWFADWNEARATSADADLREAAVVVFTRRARGAAPDGPSWATAVIDAGIDLADQYEAARRLHEALAGADAVMSADAPLLLEGLAREVPVVGWGDDEGEIARLAASLHPYSEWPRIAQSASESVEQLGRLLRSAPSRDSLVAARGLVRVHGDELEPGFLLSRLIRGVVSHPAPEPARTGRHRLATRIASRFSPVRSVRAPSAVASAPPRLVLAALPFEGVEHWRSLFEALVARGHRVTLAYDATGVPLDGGSGSNGVTVAGVLGPARTGARRRAVAALSMRLPGLAHVESPAALRWRRRVDGVALPAWVRGVEPLLSRPEGAARVGTLTRTLDESLPPSRLALRLIDRIRPDAVVLLPALDPPSALDSWSAQLDLARAARARGVPVSVSRVGALPVEDSLALGALRPNGVSGPVAASIADDLERWLATPASGPAHRPVAPLGSLGVASRLAVAAAAARMRRLLHAARPALRPRAGGGPSETR